MRDTLENAKWGLTEADRVIRRDASKNPAIAPGDYIYSAEQCLLTAQAAALIAIAERLDDLVAAIKGAEWITHDCVNAVFAFSKKGQTR